MPMMILIPIITMIISIMTVAGIGGSHILQVGVVRVILIFPSDLSELVLGRSIACHANRTQEQLLPADCPPCRTKWSQLYICL